MVHSTRGNNALRYLLLQTKRTYRLYSSSCLSFSSVLIVFVDALRFISWDLFQCLLEMTKHAPFLYTTEMENLSQLCYRAFDNSNYDVRCTVAKLLGTLLATTQNPPKELLKGETLLDYKRKSVLGCWFVHVSKLWLY